MTMGGAVLTLLCLWSCILQVTPLTEEDVGRVTNFFEQQFFRGYRYQYSYFIKFTVEECAGGLQQNELQAIRNQINAGNVLRTLRSRNIYEGARMVAAAPTYIDPNNPAGGSYHSEFRLLDPNNNSPISRLLARNPPAGCVIFHSLNSPCVGICTNPNGTFNIIDKLNNHQLPNNLQDRAFSFRDVYPPNRDIRIRETAWTNWGRLNNVMNLYRCAGNNCNKCFNNGVRNNNCFN